MEPSIFKFILRHSLRQQIIILCLTAGSFPILYLSLDLPKIIINDAINAKDFPKALLGMEFEQIPYLLLLSGVFLALVIIKSGFRFCINVYQGLLGERMLRRLRYELYSRILLFPLPHFRRVSPNEMIPMITSEVEPLGGFVGDAIALPAYYGGTLVVIFAFVFVQDPILGLAAISLYPIQGYLIPRLQRRVNELAKQRVRAVRKIARHIGETMPGVTEIHAHDTSQYELARFAGRLGRLYEIRYEIYQRKFFIKFLNGFLAQLTPFLFYTIGGYLVIEGDLSFGSLVAVLAAYKDLTPPWKELLKYYQRQADARIKYEQVMIQFQPADMMDEALQATDPEPDEPLKGDIVATNVRLEEDDQVKIIDGVSFTFGLDEHIAIVGSGASGKETLAMLIARLIAPTGGRLTIGGRDLADLAESVTGRRMAYVGPGSYMFSGSVRDNLFYGLKHRPLRPAVYDEETAPVRARALQDAVLAGNTGLDPRAGWTDYAAAGADGPESLRVQAMGLLDLVEMDDTLYEMGLRGTLDPGERPEIAERLLSAREAIHERLRDPELAGLVEPFDEAKYNDNATVAENLLFGTPVGADFDIDNLAESPYVRKVLDQVGLTSDLLEMGRQVAGLMIELFSSLDPGHEFFDQFSFIEAEDLPEFHALLGRITKEGLEGLGADDRNRLLSLPFKLIPARHRLDQIDDDMRARLLTARRAFAAELPEALKPSVEFFDAGKYNAAASLQDNILFGKVAYGQALSAERVGAMIAEVVDELGLRGEVLEVGLDYEVGIGGARLGIGQRQRLAIVRSLLKRPDLMIVNEALTALDDAVQTRILRNLIAEMKGRGLIFVSPRASLAREFGRVVVMESGKIVEQGTFAELDREGTRLHELMSAG
ncbi:MAG: ABC transporter transmembrane domain-containing protein [Alphaproteobacteria bacterium]|nr:ABC transporter transmembrane domain-containing protein [Alphaproteobacteria bacterium]